MRLIDADAILKRIPYEEIVSRCVVVNSPTIVEFEGDINKVIVKGEEYHRIVRCKDCKHRQEDTIFHKLYCDGREVVADGFCEKGERDG